MYVYQYVLKCPIYILCFAKLVKLWSVVVDISQNWQKAEKHLQLGFYQICKFKTREGLLQSMSRILMGDDGVGVGKTQCHSPPSSKHLTTMSEHV